MGIINKFFKTKKKEDQNSLDEMGKSTDETNENFGLGFSINATSNLKNTRNTISSIPVGVSTGSIATDFYVYEWFIKETGEIFYVGKGRGNRNNVFHERAYESEKIREHYETNDRLTNRVIPFFVELDNGYSRSATMPALKYETSPVLFVNEIDEHYFGIKPRAFDKVEDKNLKSVVFITRNFRNEINLIYGGNIEKYQEETHALLTANGSKVLKSKYAKSVSAWIYVGDDEVHNFEIDQQQALEKLGRNVPNYHLIDVWKFLKEHGSAVVVKMDETPTINPVHARLPLSKIKNLHNWDRGFDEGMPYWEKGDAERKAGNLGKAIELFDKAIYNGYNAPALYKSYVVAFRKLKDYDNEIDVIGECLL